MSLIFNTHKTADDYSNNQLFFNGEPGLVDTIHKRYHKIWSLYNEMRSLDWSENEFDFTTCRNDFISAPTDIIDMMLDTIFWQWEADSVASRAPTVIIAPFQPCTEVWATEQRITDNEMIHSNTYSEIVRNSFDNPEQVINDALAKTEAIRRLDLVNDTLTRISDSSKYYAMEPDYLLNNREHCYQQLILFYFTMLCLERIQFMASFAITFTICKLGYFQEIGLAVRKIAQDEFEVHCEYRKEVLRHLFAECELPDNMLSQTYEQLANILDEVINSEMIWTDELFKGRSITGINADVVKRWVLYCISDVQAFIPKQYRKREYDVPETNPLPYMNDWLSPNSIQPAPQEQTITAYKTTAVKSDDANITFDF